MPATSSAKKSDHGKIGPEKNIFIPVSLCVVTLVSSACNMSTLQNSLATPTPASSTTASSPASSAASVSATYSTKQCYFTSYPSGSKQCTIGPCSVTNPAQATATCTTTGYKNFKEGNAIYGAYDSTAGNKAGEIAALYSNPGSSFSTCNNGSAVQGEPSDAGDYYATGLEVDTASPTSVSNFCSNTDAILPQFSAAQCYFTSYPSGSHNCVTAPCSITNISTAVTACNSAGYLNFQKSGSIYGAYGSDAGSQAGEIVALYKTAATSFPACAGGVKNVNEPSDAGDYYATGLVVGSTSPSQLSNFCSTPANAIPQF